MIFLLLLTGAFNIYTFATGAMPLMTCEWYTPKTFSLDIKHLRVSKACIKT